MVPMCPKLSHTVTDSSCNDALVLTGGLSVASSDKQHPNYIVSEDTLEYCVLPETENARKMPS